ncbi:MAG: peptidoglycan-binding protein [Clostridia bacterium]|nr:peptidoglycan-binding protein [Clostridia bacterium]
MSDWQREMYEATGVLPTASPVPSQTPAPMQTPSPTSTADTSPESASNHVLITANLVNVRTAPSMTAAVVDGYLQVNQGEIYAYDAIEKDKQGYQYSWYHIYYQDTVAGYVRSDFARIMTNEEYALYLAALEPVQPAQTSAPMAYKRLALDSTGEEVLKVQSALYELGYLFETEITGVFDTLTQNAVIEYQYERGLTVNGIVDEDTWNSLFPVTDSIPTEGANNPGSSVSVTLNPVEKSDWYTGDIQSVFAPGVVAVVTDVYTGISYRVKRWAGGLHADVEPLTAADTAAICLIYGTSSAQEIADNQDQLEAWRRRPLWVTIGNRTYAASAYGVPHNDDAMTILDNNYPGQFCIHFINSKVHRTEIVDTANANNDYFGHQEAIEYAYTHSISGTK